MGATCPLPSCAAVDAENEGLATRRDWRLLQARVDEAGRALSAVLAVPRDRSHPQVGSRGSHRLGNGRHLMASSEKDQAPPPDHQSQAKAHPRPRDDRRPLAGQDARAGQDEPWEHGGP
jgi:hypothetical protein